MQTDKVGIYSAVKWVVSSLISREQIKVSLDLIIQKLCASVSSCMNGNHNRVAVKIKVATCKGLGPRQPLFSSLVQASCADLDRHTVGQGGHWANLLLSAWLRDVSQVSPP